MITNEIMSNETKYSYQLLNRVYDLIFDAYDYELSPRQISLLINIQDRKLRNELEDNDADTLSVDKLADALAFKITGLPSHPKYGDTELYKQRFVRLKEKNKDKYFERILNLKD